MNLAKYLQTIHNTDGLDNLTLKQMRIIAILMEKEYKKGINERA